MQTSKYYIPEFYIKNTLLSFFGLMITAAIFIFIIDNVNSSYMYLWAGFAAILGMLSVIIIGYCNASSASKCSDSKALYLHIFLIISFFLTDIIWGESSLLMTLFRNFVYFILLEFGVYLYKKRIHKNHWISS